MKLIENKSNVRNKINSLVKMLKSVALVISFMHIWSND